MLLFHRKDLSRDVAGFGRHRSPSVRRPPSRARVARAVGDPGRHQRRQEDPEHGGGDDEHLVRHRHVEHDRYEGDRLTHREQPGEKGRERMPGDPSPDTGPGVGVATLVVDMTPPDGWDDMAGGWPAALSRSCRAAFVADPFDVLLRGLFAPSTCHPDFTTRGLGDREDHR